MKKMYFYLLVGLASLKGFAQPGTTASDKEYDVSFYGFLRTDYIFDSRKSFSVREDQLNLYPLDVVKDVNGEDTNAIPQSNFLSVTSKVGAKVKGPNVWGAKMSGTVEADFFGNFEGSSTIGLLRLRHGFVNMDWSKTSLTMGQTWYPMFIADCFPGVTDFNTGIMFNPYGWATQVKLKQNLTREISVAITAYKEREFTSKDIGTQNSTAINSTIPSLNGLVQFKGKSILAGLGAEYKSLQPLTVSTTNKVTTEKIVSTTVFGYAKYNNDAFSVKVYGISGGNLYNSVMIGGYTGKVDANGIQTYDAVKTSACWIDIASNAKSIAPGLFFGYTKNNGSGTEGTAYMRGYSAAITTPTAMPARVIDNVWRVSGRVDFKKNKFKVSPEIEYTAASWGDADGYAKATTNMAKVANTRVMVSCVYNF